LRSVVVGPNVLRAALVQLRTWFAVAIRRSNRGLRWGDHIPATPAVLGGDTRTRTPRRADWRSSRRAWL